MNTSFTLWIIGWGIAVGMLRGKDDTVGMQLMLLAFWPLYIGTVLRNKK